MIIASSAPHEFRRGHAAGSAPARRSRRARWPRDVSSLSVAPSICGASSRALRCVADALRHRVRPGDALEQRGGTVPVGAGVGPAGRRSRLQVALTERLEGLQRAALVAQRQSQRPIRGVDVVGRRLELGQRLAPGLRRFDQRLVDLAAGWPRLSSQACVMRSTTAGGGSSAMKCRASLVRYVPRGLAAAARGPSRMASPCFTPSSS